MKVHVSYDCAYVTYVSSVRVETSLAGRRHCKTLEKDGIPSAHGISALLPIWVVSSQALHPHLSPITGAYTFNTPCTLLVPLTLYQSLNIPPNRRPTHSASTPVSFA